MTIALGLLASDGVVIAADTQMGVTDYLKTGQGKIAYGGRQVPGPSERHLATLGVTGAGNVAYLEHLQREFVGSFINAEDVPLIAHLGDEFQTRMRSFYREHVRPFSLYPPNERPDIWLLLAAQKGSQFKLWSTEKNLVTEHYTCTAVGIGSMYAKILLNRYFGSMTSLGAMLLAAYIVFQVKESIDGCGKDTDVVSLHRNGIAVLEHEKIKRLEDLFDEHGKLEADLLHHVLCNQVMRVVKPSGSIQRNIGKLRDKIKRLVNPTNVPNPQ